MELSDIVGSIRRHWRIAAAMLVLAVALVGAFVFTRNEVRPDNRYRASVEILIPVRSTKDGSRPDSVPPVLLQGQQALALDQSTLGAARSRANLSAEELRSVTFSTSIRGDIFVASATSGDAKVARRAADSFAAAYVDARANVVATQTGNEQRSTRRELDVLNRRLDEVETELGKTNLALPDIKGGEAPVLEVSLNLPIDTILLAYDRNFLVNSIRSKQARYAELGIDALTPAAFATVVERPTPAQVTPPAPSPVVPAAAILAIGALLAVAVPTVIDRVDHSIKDGKHAALAFSAPVLTAIPAASRSEHASMAKPGTDRDRAFRSLAATCVATDRLPRAILVTSPSGAIQDTVAANFAAALASLGLRVALVATDPRQSWFAPKTGAAEDPPITLPELLERAHAGRLNGEIPHRLTGTEMANLLVVPAGSFDTKMSLDGLPPLIEALSRDTIDITVIAGPALLEDPNATIFAWATRSVLWAVETGEVDEADAREAASRLVLAGVTPFGVAMVGRET
ncbi:MAG: hypothetical protein WKF43_00105 [Acidimicrobiales bacterium]